MNKKAKGRPSTGRKRYNIMCHPCRIVEVREYIKKLKPYKTELTKTVADNVSQPCEVVDNSKTIITDKN